MTGWETEETTDEATKLLDTGMVLVPLITGFRGVCRTCVTGFKITFVGDCGKGILSEETAPTDVGHTTAATLDPTFNVDIVAFVAGAIRLGDLEYVTGEFTRRCVGFTGDKTYIPCFGGVPVKPLIIC